MKLVEVLVAATLLPLVCSDYDLPAVNQFEPQSVLDWFIIVGQ